MKIKRVQKAVIVGLSIFSIAIPHLEASKENLMEPNSFTEMERAVMFDKATEPRGGKYDNFFEDGIYVCKACGAPLYKSRDKFNSSCGWPAFDDSFPNAVKSLPDPDGMRTEILCSRCGIHLGHIFKGEKLTPKNVRHCVNSVSMKFIPSDEIGRAVVAGGCFWGVEELMRRQKGVISCVSGYTGGMSGSPTYKTVSAGDSGHYEAVEILYHKPSISYSDILKTFFEIHDFTQKDGQGPDIGTQYRSAVFVSGKEQRKTAEDIISELKSRGYDVATAVLDLKQFYPAEIFHQRYYERKKSAPYCHFQRKIFH